MRIWLVRHGESEGNVDPTVHQHMADHAIPLSAKGHEQARAAGAYLAKEFGERFGDGGKAQIRLWTSPYRRTRETADGIEAGLQGASPAWVDSRREHVLLCEQQFGLFDGIPDDELPKQFPAEFAHYRKMETFEGRFWARMPLGESRFDVATRVHQAFGTFQRDRADGFENLIVVCHGVTLRAFVMMWLGLSPEWFEAEPNPANCSIRLLENSEDRGTVFPGFPRQSAFRDAPKA